ncbi:MAG TPA: hypothetical protein VGS19_32275 [Streptosporangiaceae bacterium]|nr:hypothetical protein [Streptosporangiaceae bacterium]
MRFHIPWLAAAVVAVGSLVASPLVSAHATTHATARATAWPTPLWSTQLDFDNNGTPWSESSFATLRADGLSTAEIDMPWNTIEPARGTFSFGELDQELANASAAGMKLVLIFWYSGWGGSPASWVTSHEVNSSGGQSIAPEWWDPIARPAYLTYVTNTIKHVAGETGYGGSVLDYGFLDAQWDDGSGNGGGWAQGDINKFHSAYLPQVYGTISAFNTANHTSYTAFSQVPAATPGQPLANVYQQFRVWSMRTVYRQLTSGVRAVTSTTPLYYYFGGGIENGVTYANLPDEFFSLAKRYTVTVIEDAAESPALAMLFGSLGRAYGVHVAMEWTAPGDNSQLAAAAAQWIDNYGMALPDGGGEDFFIHDGTEKDVVGFPIYINWLPNIKSLSGSFPRQPVAVYIDYSQAYGNASGGSLGNMGDEISNLWDGYQAGFAVVTSQEVSNGIVKLANYKAVLPADGVDANLTAYQAAGGHLLTAGSQLPQYAPAYASLANSGAVQVVPVVSAARTSAHLTLADVTSGTAYNDSVTFNPAGLGLVSGTYHVVDAGGMAVPQEAVPAGICTETDIAAASLAKWSVLPGAAPPGTPAPSNCADSAPVPCGTLPANHELTANQSLTSCNGDYTLIMQGDGNLVLYQGATALWASNTAGSAADEALMQSDGNFVLYTGSGSPVWSSGTAGNDGAYLVVHNGGDVVVDSASGATLWATGTKGR